MSLTVRTWAKHQTVFDRIPVRGHFYFMGGSPSGVFVKVSPTQYANPVNVRGLGFPAGYRYDAGSPINGKFLWYTGTRTTSNRLAKVIEVNPSRVTMEADFGPW